MTVNIHLESYIHDARRLVLAAQCILLNSDLISDQPGNIPSQVETILAKAANDLTNAVASFERAHEGNLG